MEKENQITIALIDDHQKLREAVARFFESCNFNVVVQAGHGEMGLNYLQMCEIVPDVCILDINMPVMDGFATAKELAKKYPHMKIVVFSSRDDGISVKEMLRLGAKGYLLKGSDPAEIKAAVLKIHKGEYYFSEEVNKVAQDYLGER